MPDTYAAELESVPLRLHLLVWVSVLFLVAALIWANLATLDEIAHADGRVIPSSEVQVIQNLEGGILAEVLCKAGDKIKQGQLLLRIDDTRFASSFDEGKFTSHALTALIARLEAESKAEAFRIPDDFPV